MEQERRREELKKIVAQFRENIDQYHREPYNEAQVRKEFVDKFFKILGWDVDNEQGHAEQYKEVVNEDAIKISGRTKAPDYGFRIGGVRKFFVEAKKPSVKLRDNPDAAFQLRRYAWNAKLSISILTNFEEFAVYLCTVKPSEKDKAAVGRLLYLTFEQYLDKFDELSNTFSKDAVLKGSFDRFAEISTGKKGTATVDEEFLEEIEQWRELLAKNIASRNKTISIAELNFAVQITLDRILFLRICEDHNIERYERLKTIASKNGIYKQILEYFLYADEKYNSGIFNLKEDKLTTHLEIDDSILKKIIDGLYYPICPYEFTVIGVEILGNVYEQFLGKIIRLTPSHQAKIEEKPEVKKAGGVFYTPQYIVNYLIKNTVGKLIKGKTPKEIEKIRVIDPACGSGSFLLAAYSNILDHHLTYYVKNDPKKFKKEIFQLRENQWQLTSERKKKILLNNIYGVDIDSQAVEVTKLSLLLKVLENETKESVEQQLKLIQERVLPDLDNNIKCGNSLIGPEFYQEVQTKLVDTDIAKRVNIFNWSDSIRGFGQIMKEGGFDIIVGNPPYIQIQTLKEFYPEETTFYQKMYKTAAQGNVDIYVPFIERSASLLKKNGILGFICPNRFFNSDYGISLRQLLKEYNLYQLVNFRHYFVFKNADTYTCLLFVQNRKQQEKLTYKEVRDLYRNKDEQVSYFLNNASKPENNFEIDEISPHFLHQEKWYFMTEDETKVFEKITKFQKFSDCYEQNFQGLITGIDEIYLLKLIENKGKNRLLFSKALQKNIELESEIVFNIIGDKDIDNYIIESSNDYIIFPYLQGKLMTEEQLQKFPLTWAYLNVFKQRLKDREHGKFSKTGWYQYSRNQAIEKQRLKKILVPHVVKMTRAAFDEDGRVFIKNVGVNGITLKDTTKEDHHYFLAILNSKLCCFFISKTSIFLSGGFYASNKQFAGEIPIKRINFGYPNEKEIHDKLVHLVSDMIQLKRKVSSLKIKSEQELLSRQIEAIDLQINDIVYELYGLTKKDKEIIEKSLALP